jgi:hypothetical protein
VGDHARRDVYTAEEMPEAEPVNAPAKVLPQRRTLDDVAAEATPPHDEYTGEVLSETPGVDLGPVDEYGLTRPKLGPCPVVSKGKPNAGKTWLELPGALVEKMLEDHGNKMNELQQEWGMYCVARRAARKHAEEQKAGESDVAKV